jgi:sporulation protein YlmC with PRC-barrel domain
MPILSSLPFSGQKPIAKEIIMNRINVITATCLLSLFIGVASAQQGKAGQSSGKSNTAGQSTGTSSGASGTSGNPSGASGGTGTSSGASGTTGGTGTPLAGKAMLGVTIVEMEAIVIGWSAKRDMLGKTVVNEKKEKIGKVDDLIITPSDVKVPFASFAIIGVGGFLGLGKNDVAIPMEQLKLQDGQLILQGATKEALKALPKFEYARK